MLSEHHSVTGLWELDWRFTKVPRYTGLKYFPQGITELSGLTAKDYRQIGKVYFLDHDVIIHYLDNASYLINVIGYPADNKRSIY